VSSAPPPYGYPPAYPAGYPQRPQKYRPSGWWFVLGTGLIIVAIGIAVGVFIWLLAAFLDFDATIDADGKPHHVTVGTDRDRMLWTDSTAQRCQLVDLSTNKRIPLHQVDGNFSTSDENGDFEGFLSFDPGSGNIEITCVQTDGSTPGTVLIGPLPRVDSLVVGVLIAIFVPAILGLTGLVIIILNGILWSTRQPKPKGV
jgi:hypothetical protein